MQTVENYSKTVFKLENLAYNHPDIDYSPRGDHVDLQASSDWIEQKMDEVLDEAYEHEYMARSEMMQQGESPEVFREDQRTVEKIEEELRSTYIKASALIE
ncbi:MAG: hypothetical protein ACLFTA_00820 [Candidatus Nanohaloarchaea archaeon]